MQRDPRWSALITERLDLPEDHGFFPEFNVLEVRWGRYVDGLVFQGVRITFGQ